MFVVGEWVDHDKMYFLEVERFDDYQEALEYARFLDGEGEDDYNGSERFFVEVYEDVKEDLL